MNFSKKKILPALGLIGIVGAYLSLSQNEISVFPKKNVFLRVSPNQEIKTSSQAAPEPVKRSSPSKNVETEKSASKGENLAKELLDSDGCVKNFDDFLAARDRIKSTYKNKGFEAAKQVYDEFVSKADVVFHRISFDAESVVKCMKKYNSINYFSDLQSFKSYLLEDLAPSDQLRLLTGALTKFYEKEKLDHMISEDNAGLVNVLRKLDASERKNFIVKNCNGQEGVFEEPVGYGNNEDKDEFNYPVCMVLFKHFPDDFSKVISYVSKASAPAPLKIAYDYQDWQSKMEEDELVNKISAEICNVAKSKDFPAHILQDFMYSNLEVLGVNPSDKLRQEVEAKIDADCPGSRLPPEIEAKVKAYLEKNKN